jgi:hypothetical protein
MFPLSVCMAFALTLISCGSQQSPTAPSDAAKPVSAQAADPSTAPVRGMSSLLWQIDRDSNPKNYEIAEDGQCTDLSFPTNTSVKFTFNRSTTSCYRDQLNPQNNGKIYYLPLNATYTWKFQTHVDTDAGALVWQIHPQDWLDTCPSKIPPVGLNFDSTTSPPTWYVFVAYGPKAGGWFSTTWKLPYTNESTDDWKIQANLAMAGAFGNWTINAWHNGKRFVDYTGLQYSAGCGRPFWNIGPYARQWNKASSPGAHMDVTFNYLELYTP